MTTKQATKTITIERQLKAPPAEVWRLWTTKAGIESWWGPPGFSVVVRALDLRAGGSLEYAMTATAPEQAAFMKRAGMPLTTETRLTYTEVTAPSRLAYINHVDFIPDVATYDTGTVVELVAVDGGTRLTVTIDAMHNDEWTARATMGWELEIGKLIALLAATDTAGRPA